MIQPGKDCIDVEAELEQATVEHIGLDTRCHRCGIRIEIGEYIYVHERPGSVRRYFSIYPVCHKGCRDRPSPQELRLRSIKERKRLQTFRPIMDGSEIGTSDADE